MEPKRVTFRKENLVAVKSHQNSSPEPHENGLETPLPDWQNISLRNAAQVGLVCPNCGAQLEGQKCKLFCRTPGCGYLVTCSEW
ncbi:MAG: hypothetical protein JO316_17600 [Abitibacteriaceae bacterium]|nr:hypothetical protein [Abditibacteriaceae bacterium]